jgi:hypothetical protein
MHEPINVKSPNNTSIWQIGFNSAFKGLNLNLQTAESAIFYNTALRLQILVCTEEK